MSAETFPWNTLISEAPEGFPILEGISVPSVLHYRWMVVVAGILAFTFAWGIGANDVANAFSTSVGAGSITLPTAVLLAAIFEFLGALLMGGNVVNAVRKKIISPEVFDPTQPEGAANGPELLMLGFLVALLASTIWLVLATYYALPVSTTHSVVGALVGVGIAYRGQSTVIWISSGQGFDKLRGLVGLILSWIISPVLSGVFASMFFLLVRTAVLRRQNPYKAGLLFMPFLYTFTVALTVFFVIYNGDKRFNLAGSLSFGEAVAIALGFGLAAALIAWFIVVPLCKQAVERWARAEMEKLENSDLKDEKAMKKEKMHAMMSKVGVNVHIEEELDDDVIRMHEAVEVFDGKAERLFSWVQVFTAAFDSFAHGANDVANAIAPFVSIYQFYRRNGRISQIAEEEFEESGRYQSGRLSGEVFNEGDRIPNHKSFCGSLDGEDYFSCGSTDRFPDVSPSPEDAKSSFFSVYDEDGANKDNTERTCFTKCNRYSYSEYAPDKQPVPIWILAMGGLGIVAGLAMWGYRIIVAIGVKLTKLTPSRGFAIEIGAAITVLIASRIGIPVSTTHCQVGATMAVGLIEMKRRTVNWKHFAFIACGWVVTAVFTGVLAGLIFAVLPNSPQAFRVPQGELQYCPGNRLFVFDVDENGFRGVGCSGV